MDTEKKEVLEEEMIKEKEEEKKDSTEDLEETEAIVTAEIEAQAPAGIQETSAVEAAPPEVGDGEDDKRNLSFYPVIDKYYKT